MAEADVVLVERALNGDRHAFSGLVARHGEWAAWVVAATLEVECRDALLATAFRRAWQQLGQLRDAAGFPHWFRGVLQREIEVHAHRHPEQVRRPAPPTADEWMDPEAQQEAAFFALPQEDREIILMVQNGRQSYEMLSDILRCSRPAFERRLLQARQRLQQELQRRRGAVIQ